MAFTFFCFFSKPSFSQSNYKFTIYTQENGLASSTVTGIAKDSAGFIWLFSENGLSRFDGYDFKTFRSDANNSQSISSPYLFGMVQNSSGNMLFQTSNAIAKYYPSNGKFKNILDFPNRAYFLGWVNEAEGKWARVTGNLVNINAEKETCSFYPFPNNFSANNYVQAFSYKENIFLTDGSGYYIFNTVSKRFTRLYFQLLTGEKSATAKGPVSFFLSQNKQPAFYSVDGFFVFDEALNIFIQQTQGSLTALDNARLAEKVLMDNYLFIQSNDGILTSINTTTGAEEKVDVKKFCTLTSPDKFHAVSIYAGLNNHVWINTLSSGIIKYNYNTKEGQHFFHDEKNPLSLPSNGCNFILEDKNVVWLSLQGLGLVKAELLNPVLKHFSPEQNLALSISSLTNNIRKVKEIDADRLLVLSLDGATVFNKSSNTFSPLINPADNKPCLEHGALSDAIYDKDSNLYVTRWQAQGVYVFNFKNKRYAVLIPSGKDKQHYSIRCAHIDALGYIWLGTVENVIIRFHSADVDFNHPEKITFTFFDHKELSDKTLQFGITFCIEEGESGIIYFGTLNGIYFYDTHANKMGSLFKTAASPITNSDIRALLFKKNNLWIGTNGGGLFCYNPRTEKVINYTIADGLPDDIIYSIKDDDKGNLWLGTNKGLCRFDPGTTASIIFSLKDGIQNFEYNTNASSKMHNGYLAFGGVSGFNFFNPDLVSKTISGHLTNQNILITQFRTGNNEREITHKTIQLKHTENFLSFQFASLNFYRNNETQYAYQLEGLDKDWVYSTNRRFTNYANVAPGLYTFKVKAANYYGEWGKEMATLKLYIKTPWYNSFLFRLSLIIVTAGIIYGIFIFRLRQKLKVQEMRNNIARDLHDEIGSNLSSISLFSAVANEKNNNVNNEISPLLKKISEYTHISQEAMNDIVWMVNTRNDSFENIIVRMRTIASEICEAKNIELHLNFNENLNVFKMGMNERKNFYLIFKEATNNIVKYAGCKNLWIDLINSNHRIILQIRDDGKGYDTTKKHTGNGLLNIHQRAEVLNGTIKINSRPGEGTSFELVFAI